MIDEYIKQAPLNNVNERVNAFSLLLSQTPLSNWQNVSQLPEDHIWEENLFQEALLACFIYSSSIGLYLQYPSTVSQVHVVLAFHN
jgi:hypothetical protein